jgi:hypothetical protein
MRIVIRRWNARFGVTSDRLRRFPLFVAGLFPTPRSSARARDIVRAL